MNSENNVAIIKGKIDSKMEVAFKKILLKLNITQQEFIEQKVKEFIIENLNIILTVGDKK